MAHDVFISYSKDDKTTADAVCNALESRGVRCWIAPRDVLPGADWSGSIVEALGASRVMVLVFSSHANHSPHIQREVHHAFERGLTVIPLRVEAIAPSPSLEFFIGPVHWLDALTPPLEAHLERLALQVERLCGVPPPRTDGPASVPAPKPPPLPPPVEQPARAEAIRPPAAPPKVERPARSERVAAGRPTSRTLWNGVLLVTPSLALIIVLAVLASRRPASTNPPEDVRRPAPVEKDLGPPLPIVDMPSPPAPKDQGLTKAQIAAELAGVPEPQRGIAAMLPLDDIPPGWVVNKSGARYLETFNRANLFEKINGRAKSFLQYDVKGLAFTSYHPVGDDSNEVQIYLFELPSWLKAQDKYGSEMHLEAKPVTVGTGGYTATGSLLFHAGPYYTQIVSTKDDARFADFSLAIAKRVAAVQLRAELREPVSTPASLFALLPKPQRQGEPKYVGQDVFGYSFLTDVVLADYKDGDATWTGFLRPYPTPEAARQVFDTYRVHSGLDGTAAKTLDVKGADGFFLSSNIGLVDAIFRKANIIGGVSGSTDAAKAEAFARSLAKALPDSLPPLEPKTNAAESAVPPK